MTMTQPLTKMLTGMNPSVGGWEDPFFVLMNKLEEAHPHDNITRSTQHVVKTLDDILFTNEDRLDRMIKRMSSLDKDPSEVKAFGFLKKAQKEFKAGGGWAERQVANSTPSETKPRFQIF